MMYIPVEICWAVGGYLAGILTCVLVGFRAQRKDNKEDSCSDQSS